MIFIKKVKIVIILADKKNNKEKNYEKYVNCIKDFIFFILT